MINKVLNWFRPAPHITRLPSNEVDRLYPIWRWRIFESAYIGYAMFYIVRNNFNVVSKEVGDALGYDNVQTGNILAATALAYGVGKFLMGYLSDRSNPRKFIAAGLLLSALVNFAFGAAHNYWVHLGLWTLNGLIQGMGYGPCARGLGHWYTYRERGTAFGFWNTAHNVGGGLVGVIAGYSARSLGWTSAFYVPGVIACLGAIYLFYRMRDTPQSLGLPPIEEFKNQYPPDEKAKHERELSFKELLVTYILTNKYLWLIAIANFFVYAARYALIDWGPTFLKTTKGATVIDGGWSITFLEFSGAAGMLLMGWISDRFQGRRGAVSFLCMIPLPLAFVALLWIPSGKLSIAFALFAVIGFFVYVPVMMLGVMSLDLTSKKAVGAAAGFVGMFGYVGRVAESAGVGWMSKHIGWNSAFYSISGCTLVAILLLAFTWNVRPKG